MVNEETKGELKLLPQFLGQAITEIGGGNSKVFVLEEGEGFETRVTSIHHEKESSAVEEGLATA